MPRFAAFAASAVVAVAFAALAFGAKGGTQLGRITWAEVAMVVVGGAIVAVAVARGRRDGPLHGGIALLAFAVFTALTALSIAWSIAPELSWIETNRTVAYLVAFAAGIALARLAPGGWATLLRGLVAGVAIVVGYAFLARVFPDQLATTEAQARIGQPFGYWNALGGAAAMALPAALWHGARRSGRPLANALAYPATGAFVAAIFLSYSRGALLAAAIVILIWFAVVPLRIRSLAVLGVGAAGAAPVIVWAASRDAFSLERLPPIVRSSIAAEFGMAILAMLAVLLAVGLAVHLRVSVRAPSVRFRRRIGLAAAALAILVPLVAISSVAASERGVGGTVERGWDQLVEEESTAPGTGAERLTATSSSRGRYWREAGRVFDQRPGIGAGAGGYEVARLRHRSSESTVVRHAHGFVPQVMADLGIAGLVVVAILLLAWLAGAARATALGPRLPWPRGRAPRPTGFSAERVGLVALLLVPVAFGVHSAVDWTWFTPALSAGALVGAGFVVGRGPLPAGEGAPTGPGGAAILGRAPQAPSWRDALARVRRAPRSLLPPPPATSARRGRLSALRRWTPLAVALAALVTALLAAWTAWQPQRAQDRLDEAYDLLAENRFAQARAAAADAHEIDGLSVEPLLVQAAVEDAAGRPEAALGVLERAAIDYPRDPQVWLRLADFQLHKLDRPEDALETLRAAMYLDPLSPTARSIFLEARGRQAAKAAQAQAGAPGAVPGAPAAPGAPAPPASQGEAPPATGGTPPPSSGGGSRPGGE